MKNNKAFTLLELVIVMSLFTIILMVVTSLLLTVSNSLDKKNNEFYVITEYETTKEFIKSNYDINNEFVLQDNYLTCNDKVLKVVYLESFVKEDIVDNKVKFTLNYNNSSYYFILDNEMGGI